MLARSRRCTSAAKGRKQMTSALSTKNSGKTEKIEWNQTLSGAPARDRKSLILLIKTVA